MQGHKSDPRIVNSPKGMASNPDPNLKTNWWWQHWGRNIYFAGAGSSKDIKYGDVLDSSNKEE